MMKPTVELQLAPEDLNLVLVALGRLPYVQVHELIGRIQAQAGPQLLAAKRAMEQAGGRPEPGASS
jgi:hypothetical protein